MLEFAIGTGHLGVRKVVSLWIHGWHRLKIKYSDVYFYTWPLEATQLLYFLFVVYFSSASCLFEGLWLVYSVGNAVWDIYCDKFVAFTCIYFMLWNIYKYVNNRVIYHSYEQTTAIYMS
jgi:hypothetical protein